jgi:hypothetical protein
MVKGKEPAGLRRWRLAHKKGTTRRVKRVAKGKGRRGGSRTRYARAVGFVRRHKWTVPSVAGGVLFLAAARRFGWFTAMNQALNGGAAGFQSAANTLIANANIGNLIPIAAGGIALTMVRGIVGQVPIMKVGKWTVRAI